VSTRATIRLTFSQRSKTQQAIFDHLKDEPELIMTALIDRYQFLALAEIDRPEKELAKALIESNAALMKAIEINNAIAARQGIIIATMATKMTAAPPKESLPSKSPLEPDDEDWDDDDLAEPPKKPAKLKLAGKSSEIEDLMGKL
jgi:hypothetical protein